MATYIVNMPALAEVAQEMAAIAQSISSMLEELENSTAQNLSQWASAARDAYNLAKAIWDRAAADMVTQAARAQASLSSINDNYGQAERAGVSLWS
jgi:WXG100 family type VII secretion target